jgi:hypothetical protein
MEENSGPDNEKSSEKCKKSSKKGLNQKSSLLKC